MNDQRAGFSGAPRRIARLAIILIGVFLGQALLYGPSFVGKKILLPLDILARPRYFIPQTPELAGNRPHNRQLSDLVLHYEPARRYLGSEIRAGRLPLWNPYHFAGAPNTLPLFSPFTLLGAAIASPRVLPWVELLKALTCALGIYLFCRRALLVAFWPAAIAAWCYPLTAFFVLWQGFHTADSVLWMPWLLLAVQTTARGGRLVAPVGLSLATCLVLAGGQLDIAAQVLLVSGFYGVWLLWDAHPKPWRQPQARKAALALVAGWSLGVLLAAPAVLPVVEYAKTGGRMAHRISGEEERPPVGLPALPQVVLPKMYGLLEPGSFPIFPKGQGNLAESTAAAYTGVLATLFLAPLAWCSRRHRSMNVFLALLAFLALSWSLNVPGLVNLLRLPGLNMMSHNRLAFAASFAILALAAIGLDVLGQGWPRWRWWFWLPVALLLGLYGWCIYRNVVLPEPIATHLEAMVRRGDSAETVRDLTDVQRTQQWFSRTSQVAAGLCGLGLAGWLLLWRRQMRQRWLVPVLGVVLMGDLLLFDFGRPAQCEPALYYPRISVLEEIQKSVPGRIIGYNCLPANLAMMCGLREVRGYDGVDPARLVDLLSIGADARSVSHRHARVQLLMPNVELRGAGGPRLPPVFDMLNVRYVVFRDPQEPDVAPAFQGPDYWVLVNSNALPRAYVPRRVEVVADAGARLKNLASRAFNPRDVAYLEVPVDLPMSCRGTAEIVEEIPTRIKVAVRMETPGLVVLADLWDQGWQARLNGRRVPILRANHAIRGVVVPAGAGTLEFRYEPAGFAWGLRLAGLAAVILAGWVGVFAQSHRRRAKLKGGN